MTRAFVPIRDNQTSLYIDTLTLTSVLLTEVLKCARLSVEILTF